MRKPRGAAMRKQQEILVALELAAIACGLICSLCLLWLLVRR